jgi:F-type H+-transporting ATPase subunit gamma
MASLQLLQKQIDTVDTLRTVVKTMKNLAAVSIRQYEQAAESLSIYSQTVDLGFQALLSTFPLGSPQARTRTSGLGIILIGSDEGMCGQFNENIASYMVDTLGKDETAGRSSLIVVGHRAAVLIEEDGYTPDRLLPVPGSVSGILPLVQELLILVESWWREQQLERILLFGNRRKSGANYEEGQTVLLPFNWKRLQELGTKEWKSRSLPSFTMQPEPLLAALIREYLSATLFLSLAESLSAENASRLAAMHGAERNVEERLDNLKAQYHRERQISITSELLDVVSGFEVLRTEEG